VGFCAGTSNGTNRTSPASLSSMVILVAHFSQSQKCSMGLALLRMEATSFLPAIANLLLSSVKLIRNSLPLPKYLKVAEQRELRHFDTIEPPRLFSSLLLPRSLIRNILRWREFTEIYKPLKCPEFVMSRLGEISASLGRSSR